MKMIEQPFNKEGLWQKPQLTFDLFRKAASICPDTIASFFAAFREKRGPF